MARLNNNESGNDAGASSGPSSNNQTPKSLKSKPTIAKKFTNTSTICTGELKDTPPVQKRKIKKKKKSVTGSKIINSNAKEDVQNPNSWEVKQKNVMSGEHRESSNTNLKKKNVMVSKNITSSNDKEDSQNLARKEMKQKNVISAEHSRKNQENFKNKLKRAGLKSKQHNEENRENLGASENQQGKQKNEDSSGLSKMQHDRKDRKKFNGVVGNEHKLIKEEKNRQLASEQNEKSKKKLGGLIFMCNSRTKPDCFHYRVMGVSINKKGLVLGIKPGLKLFLYDFDLKLLYGIYMASSSGGTKLEPAAFNGAFPVQVRFDIYQDCYPLPENVFRRAINENYYGKSKFNTELTVQQVTKLMELFSPAQVKLHAPPIHPPPAVSVDRREVNERETELLAHHQSVSLARDPRTYDEGRRYDVHLNENDEHLVYRGNPSTQRENFSEQLFLSEKDYRTYGLRRERRNATPPRSHIAPTLEPDSGARVREHLLLHPGNMCRDAAPVVTHHDQYLATDKIYQAYGQFPTSELQSSDPLVTTASIVDSYLKVPYYGASMDPYQPPLREKLALGSYSLGGSGETYHSKTDYSQREIYPTRSNHFLVEGNHLGRRENDDVGTLYSTYASNDLSQYNQVHTSQGIRSETSVAPVTARYSFAGPSLSRHYP